MGASEYEQLLGTAYISKRTELTGIMIIPILGDSKSKTSALKKKKGKDSLKCIYG